MMKKVLLDTDIGSDIDDSLTISYLLKKKECDLLGITTVSSDTLLRAKMISAFCKEAKKDIPIYPGIRDFLLWESKHPIFLSQEKLDRWPHDTVFPNGEAIEFMRKTIRKHPGEVTLLGIGPLTNIAMLFTVDPEIPLLLKELVLMCGVFQNPAPECNAYCDPYATFIVYNSKAKIKSIGLDVTMQTIKDKDEVVALSKGTILDIAMDYGDEWFERTNEVVFHDPLAAATIFEDVCGFEEGKVLFDLEGEHKWVTRFDATQKANQFVAFTVDKERFYKEFFETIRK